MQNRTKNLSLNSTEMCVINMFFSVFVMTNYRTYRQGISYFMWCAERLASALCVWRSLSFMHSPVLLDAHTKGSREGMCAPWLILALISSGPLRQNTEQLPQPICQTVKLRFLWSLNTFLQSDPPRSHQLFLFEQSGEITNVPAHRVMSSFLKGLWLLITFLMCLVEVATYESGNMVSLAIKKETDPYCTVPLNSKQISHPQ